MLSTLSFAHQALEGLARSAGYDGAAEALVDLTAEQPVWPPVVTVSELYREVEQDAPAEAGASVNFMGQAGFTVDERRDPPVPKSNAERNEGRSKDPALVEALRAYRAAGLTAAEQARVLNHQQGRDYWTAQRVRVKAHQAGLTTTPAKRGKAVAGRG